MKWFRKLRWPLKGVSWFIVLEMYHSLKQPNQVWPMQPWTEDTQSHWWKWEGQVAKNWNSLFDVCLYIYRLLPRSAQTSLNYLGSLMSSCAHPLYLWNFEFWSCLPCCSFSCMCVSVCRVCTVFIKPLKLSVHMKTMERVFTFKSMTENKTHKHFSFSSCIPVFLPLIQIVWTIIAPIQCTRKHANISKK